ncbi:MAG: PaaI family thioesterase [Mycobacterium sp.]|nr:PaaI family thioesterase [Mycobacterium sp.]
MDSGNAISDQLAQHITNSFARQGLMRHLGAAITELRTGYCEIRAPFTPDLTQQHGYFHAGVTSALVDTAGGYAGLSTYKPSDSILTVDFSINLLAPAAGDELVAQATVIKSGRTLAICELQAYTLRDGTRTHVATGRQTLIRLLNTSDTAAAVTR